MPTIALPRLDTTDGLAEATEIYIATCLYPNDPQARANWLVSKSAKVKGILPKENDAAERLYSSIFQDHGGYAVVSETEPFTKLVIGAAKICNSMYISAEMLRIIYAMAHNENLQQQKKTAGVNRAAFVLEQCKGNGRVPLTVPSNMEAIMSVWGKHKDISHMCLPLAYIDFALRFEEKQGRLHNSHFLNKMATCLPFMIELSRLLYNWSTTYQTKGAREPLVSSQNAWNYLPTVLDGTHPSKESVAFLKFSVEDWLVLSPAEIEAALRYRAPVRS